MKYEKEAAALWRSSVPSRGQADTVQGELLRAAEKLRDESMRNGNCNWDAGHQLLLDFVRTTLLAGSEGLRQELRDELVRDLDRIQDYDTPITNDALFDRVVDRVMEWCLAHPEPIPHPHDPRLKR